MDEATKQKAMFAFIAFNIVVVLFQLLFNSSPFAWTRLFLGLVIGGLVAGATYGITHYFQNR
jgi:hypothetical protein